MFALIAFTVFVTAYLFWTVYQYQKDAGKRRQQKLLEEQKAKQAVEAHAAYLKAEEARRKVAAQQLAATQAKEAEAQAATLRLAKETSQKRIAEQRAKAQAEEAQRQAARAELARQNEAARLEADRQQAAEREAKKAEHARKQAEELKQAQRELAAKTPAPKSSPVTSPQPIANPSAFKPAPEPLRNAPQHGADALTYCEQDSDYCATLAGRFNALPTLFSFDAVRGLTRDHGVFDQLQSGVRILDTHEQLMQYIFSYGKMHKAKLYQAFDVLLGSGKIDLTDKHVQLYDYGCGQALATVLLINYLKNKGNTKFKSISVVLIEPSEMALKRGALHARYSLKSIAHTGDIAAYCVKLSGIAQVNMCSREDAIQFHLFSNILDVPAVDCGMLHNHLKNQLSKQSYFVCVSPNLRPAGPWHPRNNKLHEFAMLFCNQQEAKIISSRETDILGGTIKPWTRFERVFSVGSDTINPAHSNSLVEDDNSFTVI